METTEMILRDAFDHKIYNTDKWFSVSDIEQLQKELRKFRPFDEYYQNYIDEVFNNFKGK